MKKKILYFAILVFVLIGILLLVNDGNLLVAATDYASEEEGMSIGMAIFCELFVSIHMSVFVLFPLAGFINRNKTVPVFIWLFTARAFILLIGDLINPTATMLIDFMAVFFGAFIIVPCVGFFKKAAVGDDLRYHEYIDVDHRELSTIGYSDLNLVKRVLSNIYVDIKEAFSANDRKRLIELCSKHKYILYKNELELLEKVDERKMFDSFDIVEMKVHDVYNNKKEIIVSAVCKISCIEYTVDRYNKVTSGSDREPNNYIVALSFKKKLQHEEIKECPNCGSPRTQDGMEFCSYCGTELNFNIGEFVLSEERIITK